MSSEAGKGEGIDQSDVELFTIPDKLPHFREFSEKELKEFSWGMKAKEFRLIMELLTLENAEEASTITVREVWKRHICAMTAHKKCSYVSLLHGEKGEDSVAPANMLVSVSWNARFGALVNAVEEIDHHHLLDDKDAEDPGHYIWCSIFSLDQSFDSSVATSEQDTATGEDAGSDCAIPEISDDAAKAWWDACEGMMKNIKDALVVVEDWVEDHERDYDDGNYRRARRGSISSRTKQKVKEEASARSRSVVLSKCRPPQGLRRCWNVYELGLCGTVVAKIGMSHAEAFDLEVRVRNNFIRIVDRLSRITTETTHPDAEVEGGDARMMAYVRASGKLKLHGGEKAAHDMVFKGMQSCVCKVGETVLEKLQSIDGADAGFDLSFLVGKVYFQIGKVDEAVHLLEVRERRRVRLSLANDL